MLTAAAIRKTFDGKYNVLRHKLNKDYPREAVRFAKETYRLAGIGIEALPDEDIPEFNAAYGELFQYLGSAILEAEVQAYNLEWDVVLKMEPEK